MKSCKECIHYVVCSDIAEKFIEAFSSGTDVADVCKNFDNKSEIVKCKECEHCDKKPAGYFCYDPRDQYSEGVEVQADDFCSYGKKII